MNKELSVFEWMEKQREAKRRQNEMEYADVIQGLARLQIDPKRLRDYLKSLDD
jgi:hypothetical protein